MVFLSVFERMNLAYEAVNFTTSTGLNPSAGFPPIVPLIPDIDFINVIYVYFTDD